MRVDDSEPILVSAHLSQPEPNRILNVLTPQSYREDKQRIGGGFGPDIGE
jgi:hypothetical protein